MKQCIYLTSLLLALMLQASQSWGFCGFYVAKADTGLFNNSSQVVYVRDGDRNVVTMGSDFRGDVQNFAMVVPVPTVLEREQINVSHQAIVDHLDAYTAPRLVEYFDADPCAPVVAYAVAEARAVDGGQIMLKRKQLAAKLGVTIEAEYTVEEYDILLLSATQSDGLVTWLNQQGYQLPAGAGPVIGSYLKQNMKFFVAKVNLKNFDQSGYTRLRPIQIAYEHDRFMLPIRLGTVNAEIDEANQTAAKQELFVYALTRKGRVQTTNYRTVPLPSNVEVPTYIKDKQEFADFYRTMFSHQNKRQGNNVVFMEYAWDMNWCDPCAADPLTSAELRELGVFWVTPEQQRQAQDVYVTRLHVRYDQANFPEDLMFQLTANRDNYQGRFILRHPWTGAASCQAGKQYLLGLPKRFEQQAQNLANLTGQDIAAIRAKMVPLKSALDQTHEGEVWWRGLWQD